MTNYMKKFSFLYAHFFGQMKICFKTAYGEKFIYRKYICYWYTLELPRRQFQCEPTTYVTESKEENYLEIHFPSIMSIVFTSFKHPKLHEY